MPKMPPPPPLELTHIQLQALLKEGNSEEDGIAGLMRNLLLHEFPLQNALVDTKTLGEQNICALRELIAYRNAQTGAGRWLGGIKGETKLRVGYRMGEIIAIANLLDDLEEVVEISSAIKANLEALFERISNIELLIKKYAKEKIRRAIPDLRKNELELKGEALACYYEKIYPTIAPFEAITLGYLKIIDTVLDVFLLHFGLTKDSKL